MQSRTAGRAVVLRFSGRFDAHTASVAAAALDRAVTETPHIVVQLGDAFFLDSIALAILVQGMKRCRQRGGDLRLADLQQPVRMVFELTRLDKAFDIFDNETQALESFA